MLITKMRFFAITSSDALKRHPELFSTFYFRRLFGGN